VTGQLRPRDDVASTTGDKRRAHGVIQKILTLDAGNWADRSDRHSRRDWPNRITRSHGRNWTDRFKRFGGNRQCRNDRNWSCGDVGFGYKFWNNLSCDI